jgi:hypothetical protein
MPAFNGTGPAGMGLMTGRGRGYCNPYPGAYGQGPMAGPASGRAGYVPGNGRFWRRGFGFGRSRDFARAMGPGTGLGRGWRGASSAWRGW